MQSKARLRGFDQSSPWAVEHSLAIWSALKTRLSSVWESWDVADTYTHEHTGRYEVASELPLRAELEA